MKEMKILVLRKKRLLAVVLTLILCCLAGGGAYIAATISPAGLFTVVIDAGHGGIDAGVVGKNGTKESDFNLTMAKELGERFSKAGFKVVYTRKNADGLYGNEKKDFKRKDMAARKKTIVDTDPDLVISVHANKFPGDDRRGAQVFYDEMNKSGKDLAILTQEKLNELNEKNVGRKFEALSGDYYVLKCTAKPSIIVECGFLSNVDDEKLLNDAEHRAKLAEAIVFAATDYFALNGNNYA